MDDGATVAAAAVELEHGTRSGESAAGRATGVMAPIVQNPLYHDVGVDQDGHRLWLFFASPYSSREAERAISALRSSTPDFTLTRCPP